MKNKDNNYRIVNTNQPGQLSSLARKAVTYAQQHILLGNTKPFYNQFKLDTRNQLANVVRAMRSTINHSVIVSPIEAVTLYNNYLSASQDTHVGNCLEIAIVAFNKFHSDHPEINAEIFCITDNDGENANHVFFVVGRNPNSDEKNPNTWGKDTLICDGWQIEHENQVYPISQLDKLKSFHSIIDEECHKSSNNINVAEYSLKKMDWQKMGVRILKLNDKPLTSQYFSSLNNADDINHLIAIYSAKLQRIDMQLSLIENELNKPLKYIADNKEKLDDFIKKINFVQVMRQQIHNELNYYHNINKSSVDYLSSSMVMTDFLNHIINQSTELQFEVNENITKEEIQTNNVIKKSIKLIDKGICKENYKEKISKMDKEKIAKNYTPDNSILINQFNNKKIPLNNKKPEKIMKINCQVIMLCLKLGDNNSAATIIKKYINQRNEISELFIRFCLNDDSRPYINNFINILSHIRNSNYKDTLKDLLDNYRITPDNREKFQKATHAIGQDQLNINGNNILSTHQKKSEDNTSLKNKTNKIDNINDLFIIRSKRKIDNNEFIKKLFNFDEKSIAHKIRTINFKLLKNILDGIENNEELTSKFIKICHIACSFNQNFWDRILSEDNNFGRAGTQKLILYILNNKPMRICLLEALPTIFNKNKGSCYINLLKKIVKREQEKNQTEENRIFLEKIDGILNENKTTHQKISEKIKPDSSILVNKNSPSLHSSSTIYSQYKEQSINVEQNHHPTVQQQAAQASIN